jgi:hypothetical protein
LGALACACLLGIGPAAAQSWPSQVQAVYRIGFGGLDLGNFEFNSTLNGSTYTLSGQAQITAVFGAYEWKGQSRSAGAVAATGPRPASYAFNFKNQSKVGAVQMGFADNSINKLSVEPPSHPHPTTVPVKPEHLKDVLDPLSAVMALTRAPSVRVAGSNPCARRLAIFDGKQRFDLVFGFKRTADLGELGIKGQPRAVVCRVRYVPIAGYRPNEETVQMSQQTGIEVWMVPMADANMFVPYHVAIPTGAGTATLTASRLNIQTARGRIALSH